MNAEKDNILQIKRLSSDDTYFNNVFKKTEKLISVIFYILSHIDKRQVSETHLDTIKDKALKTHEISLDTLSVQSHEVYEALVVFQHSLLGLESTVRIAEAAGVLPRSVTPMLFEQFDSLQRYINNHYTKDVGFSIEDTLVSGSALGLKSAGQKAKSPNKSATRRRRVQVPAGDISTDAYFVHSQMTDRSERIKTVLEAKPQATIKDISEIVTDVSEKTIQRELNSLIEKGQVKREGERRWSRYSIA